MRIAFAGTSDFAVPSLRALVRGGLEIVAVYTQPDRPAGRGRKLKQSPIKQFATAHQLPLCQPESLVGEFLHLKKLAPELIVVSAYGLILPPDILDLPRFGCINVHASLLPRWRGAAPIQRAIEAGDQRTGITLIQMDDELDSGNILFQTETPILTEDTSGSLHDRLAEIGAKILSDRLLEIASGKTTSTPQAEEDATYASKLSPLERWIDWTRPAVELERQIRAFNPDPLARTMLDYQTILLWQASLGPINRHADPGTVVAARGNLIRVQTGDGSLELRRIQLPGRQPLDSREFLNGYPLSLGKRFQHPDHADC